MQTDGVRHTVVTPDNHGPIIQIVTWFAMVVMILATALRLAVRYLTSHIPGMDDAIVVGSMVYISAITNPPEGLVQLGMAMVYGSC